MQADPARKAMTGTPATSTAPHTRSRSAGAQNMLGSQRSGSTRPSKLSISTTVGDSLEGLANRKSNKESRVSRSLGNMLDIGASRDQQLDALRQSRSPRAISASMSTSGSLGIAGLGSSGGHDGGAAAGSGADDSNDILSRSVGISDDDLQQSPINRGLSSSQPASAFQRANYVWSPFASSVSPIVRSRSSFAIHILNSMAQVLPPPVPAGHNANGNASTTGTNAHSSLIAGSTASAMGNPGGAAGLTVSAGSSERPLSGTHAALVSHLETALASRSTLNSLRASNPRRRSADSIAVPDEEGFLKDIEMKGFSGIWNHPVTRIYFLMFLIWKRLENFYFFRLDTIAYRTNWQHMTPASRIGGAKAMYREYLSATRASFPLRWPTDINDPTIEEIIDAITSCLESPDPTILDDISFVAMQTLESIYAGTYMPSDGENDFHMSAEAYEIKRFRKSAFYQAMRNDLRGTLHVTTIQHTRAIERLADLASTVPADAVVWEKIFSTLEGIFPEADSVVSKSINLARKRTTSVQAQQAQVQVQAHAALGRTRSTSSLRGDNDDTPASQPATKSRNISVQSTVSRAFDSSAPSHTFLPYTMNEHMFCEYCNLKLALDKGTDDALSAHRCESCGYLCHRNCRNLIRVTCSKPSAAIDLEVGPEVHSEKLRLVTEKLGALQKEIDIEMKIRDGLEKITKAKHGGGSGGSGGGSGMKLGKSGKKSQQEMDVTSQLDRNSKRLEMLKHELQKRRLQMQSLQQQANAQEALQQAQDLERNAGSDSANGSRSAISASVATPNTGGSAEDLQDGGLIRVAIEDPTTKMQSKKAIYIKENQSTLEVITRIMEKANLTGSPNDFVLVYAGPKGDSILVKDEDRPLQLENVDFSHTFFKVIARSDKNFHAPRDPNTPQIKKQREILSEILDSENNYCQDIKNVIQAFLSPFEASGLLDVPTLEQIFSNIQEISAVHDSLGKALKEVSEDISPGPIIKCFTDAVPHFKCYTTYCGNQHHARRILGRMSSDTAFQKLLQKCESNPKLHKLTIADMLVKPMHRITRYPLLFKRLLPNLDTNSHEHIALTGLLIEIEAIISNVNDTLKKREAAYRIRLMDEILDFGVVAERFTIAVDGRELISEKPLMYHKKSSNVPVDVTLMVFSDMIMMVRPKKGDHLQLFKPPMPLESVVLLDKPDASEKTMFQIVHLEQETYLMQALSVYDKNSWLQEAESTRARFCALHYDIEQAYVRMQTGRYKLLNLARQPAEYDDRPPLSAYDDNYSSSLSLPFKVKRRTSDASTRKGLPINDADRIRNEETPTIKRNSSLLQLFKMRRNDDPSSQPQSQNPSQMQQQLSGGDDYGTPTTAGIPDDPNGQGALFFGTGHLGGFGGGGSLGGGSAGSGSASIASSRQDTRMSTARGSMGDAIQERPEIPSPASQSPNLSATSASAIAGGSAGANALSTSKSRLVRKETAGKRLSSIFRFSTPALDTSVSRTKGEGSAASPSPSPSPRLPHAQASSSPQQHVQSSPQLLSMQYPPVLEPSAQRRSIDKGGQLSSPTKDRSSISPLSAQDRPSMAVLDQATDVTVSSGFDIDSFLAEGGAGGVGGPENMSAVNQQAEKRRSGIGVMGKVRRSLKPQQGSTSPGPMTPQPADTSPTRRDLDE